MKLGDQKFGKEGRKTEIREGRREGKIHKEKMRKKQEKREYLYYYSGPRIFTGIVSFSYQSNLEIMVLSIFLQ